MYNRYSKIKLLIYICLDKTVANLCIIFQKCSKTIFFSQYLIELSKVFREKKFG